nr:hypothetical protein [Tanacetum cinerariifolium]
MNQEQIQQAPRDEALVPTDDRFTLKKVKKSSFYQFDLDDRKFQVDVELFQKILRICPRVPDKEFVVPPSHDSLLTYLKELGYKGPLELKFISKGELTQVYRLPIPDTMFPQKLKGIQVLSEEEQLAADTKKAIKANKKAIKIQQQSAGSSKGASFILKVPNEPKGSSVAKIDAEADWGFESKSKKFDEKDVNEGEVEWISTDYEEKADDDEIQDDDKSIDIEETNDERTESENDD